MNQGNHPKPLRAQEAHDEQAPQFAARLFPHRSLPMAGYLALMVFVGATAFASGMLFLAIGAWPVLAFFGLDVLLLWLAFRASYRSGRAFEEVAVWPHDLLVRQVCARGRVKEHRFNPFFARFNVDRHEEFGIRRMWLAGEGRELDIGAFLNPPDRESFALAFAQALAAARRG